MTFDIEQMRKNRTACRPLQERVGDWMQECFGPEISADKLERGDRLLEEVYELLQSGDYPVDRVAALRDYVFGREKGEPFQEVGGVMITLAAYCLAHDLDMDKAGEAEADRITRPEVVKKIRAKQAAKPVGSALPVDNGSETEIERLTAALETARADALREAAGRIKAKIDEDQPNLSRWAVKLAAAQRPSVKYAIRRAAVDARISDHDMILSLIEKGGDA